MKAVTILGSTGSIGTQALSVLRQSGCSLLGLGAHSNIHLLLEQIKEHHPRYVAVVLEDAAATLEAALETMPGAPRILRGEGGLLELAALPEADLVLNAVVGVAGLAPTLAALGAGKPLALANKESLVAGGQLVMGEAKRTGAQILPVDSEHSAIFQCLQDEESAKTLRRILLTASGGPFFGKTRNELQYVKPEEALRHPNWNMGARVTIDSATMMNKGLELMEAMWLFNMPEDKIDILVHRQSIVHSLVEFADGAVLAQLGVPDMRLPIQYAFTWPGRAAGDTPRLDLAQIGALTFAKPDEETFRCLAACRLAARKGGLYPAAANGADEEAFALFMQEKIGFNHIGDLVAEAVETLSLPSEVTLENIYEADKLAREQVRLSAARMAP